MNIESSPELTKAFDELVSLPPNSAEANVESVLREYLSKCCTDVDWILQTTTAGGTEDLTSTQLNIVIECKRPGSIDLKDNENQLKKYLRSRHSPKDNLTWRGFITDGNLWWGYDFDSGTRLLKPIKGLVSHRVNEESVLRKLCETYIFSRYDSTRLREASINDVDLLDKMFRARYRELENVQREHEAKLGYQTKIQLWEMQLRGSGIISPSNEHSSFSEQFRQHTFIVIISRMLCAYLSEKRVGNAELLDSVADGFQSWVLDSSEGQKVLTRLIEDIRQYSWRNSTRDVLKTLYEGLIPQEKRKEFGEYYTPDELAITVVNEVLDDAWCDVQIRRSWNILKGLQDDRQGLGVLDPACGSGTFLFHAAKRLCERIASHHRQLKNRTAEIVARLVFGIDIHPIAVEMSHATLLMALPYSDTPLRLYIALGDAMQTEGHGYMFSLEGLTVTTPKGSEIVLARSVLENPQALDIISWAVERYDNSVVDDEYESNEDCMQLAEALENVIDKEDDHVWKWHLSNRYTLHTLITNCVGRLVGNPPWLVRNDTPDGTRKKNMDILRKDEGMYTKVAGYLAQGDLASLFTARITRLYLDTAKSNNRYAWVLPGSALINQVWQNWRTGTLIDSTCMHHQVAWALDDITPPVFEHSPNGTCVVIGSKEKVQTPPDLSVEIWSGNFETAKLPMVNAHSIQSLLTIWTLLNVDVFLVLFITSQLTK